MINKILGLFILLAVTVSCTDPEDDVVTKRDGENLPENFSISGTVKNTSNAVFKLEAMSATGPILVAKAKADNNGNFKIVGNIPSFGLYQLKIGETETNIIPLTMVPNDHLTINATSENFTISPALGGTSWSRVASDYMKLYSDFHLSQEQLMKNQGKLNDTELTKMFKQLKAPVDSFCLKEMTDDPFNPYNIVLCENAKPMMGFNDWDSTNLTTLNTVCNAYNQKFPNSPMTRALSQQVMSIEASYKQHILNTSGRFAPPEIALNNPDGVEIKLSSLKGQYVLIDFWASWCGPCRRANKKLVELYNKYKNQGFTVYSVSLDDKHEAWTEAIKKDGLVWPNHVSDLLNFNSPLPQQYGFSGIPHTVLLNKEGNIIGVGLRDNSLEQKLKEIFSN